MRTSNFYDFGLLEVNPPANKSTGIGFSGTALRAPKKGDRKNWRKFLIFCLAFYKLDLAVMKPAMAKLNVSMEDVEQERFATQNRVVRINAESERLNRNIKTSGTRALQELNRLSSLQSQIKFHEKYNQGKVVKEKKRLQQLTSDKKTLRRNKLISQLSELSTYDKFLIRSLREQGLLD